MKRNFVKRVYLNEIVVLLNKTRRSVKNWCKNNSVVIYNDGSSKFVTETDLYIAMDAPIILELIRNYGKELGMKLYNSYKNENIEEILLSKFDINNLTPNLTNGYKPKSNSAKNFLND